MRKLTYEYVKGKFENEEYILLSDEYINSRHKLDYICSNRHKHSITWGDFKSGRRCYYCGLENSVSKRRLNFDIIKKSFDDENYVLLTQRTDYKNVDQRLEFICNNNHRHSISWHNWNSGWRCAYCHRDKLSVLFIGSGHPNWKGGISCEPYCQDWTKEFKDFIKERDGYKCLNPDCFGNVNKICVHHIDYNKKNCHPYNLITLCVSCNSRANKDRRWHKAWYQAINEKRIIRRN